MHQDQQAVAVNTLKEISNQDTSYQWITARQKHRNHSTFVKPRKQPLPLNKSTKLPPICQKPHQTPTRMSTHIIQTSHNMSTQQQIQNSKMRIQKIPRKCSKSVRLFFREVAPTVYPNKIQEDRVRENQLSVIKSWLTRKKLECKSLQVLISKKKQVEDTAKLKCGQHVLPFNIKMML